MDPDDSATFAEFTEPLTPFAAFFNVSSSSADYFYDYGEDDYHYSSNTSMSANNESIIQTKLEYCSTPEWDNFRKSYQAVHGCMSLIVCVFGSIANVINIVVLTRRSMVSPTNAILTGLAVADLLVMVDYIPYIIHQYIWQGRSLASQYSWGWAVFIVFHAYFAQVFHTISIWLTVTLAVWRYIAIGYPQHNSTCCSMRRTLIAIAFVFFCTVICNIPNYLSLTIIQIEHSGHLLHIVRFSELATAHGGLLKSINFWIYAVLLKLLPCAALTGLSMALIQELMRAARRRSALMNGTSSGRCTNTEKQADRVTKMLLAILVLFLASEVPQGILGLLTVIPDSVFFPCYLKLGEVMDMLVLLNSAINFLIYCAMSQQFRETFTEISKLCCDPLSTVRVPRPLPGWKAVQLNDPHIESNTTCISHA